MKSPFINVTIPVYNEEKTLETNVGKVVESLKSNCPHVYEIVIANNGSTDQTQAVAKALSRRYPEVSVANSARPGRGLALKSAWSASKADIFTYMDCDLSSDLTAFPKLIEPLIGGGFEVSVGSRLLNSSMTSRGLKREVLSRGYNLLVKGLFQTKFSDAQCGFKAITRSAANRLLPLVEDDRWFADTELLVLAERMGCRIFDLPVRWVDDPDSKVRIWRTILEDLHGLLKLRMRLTGKYVGELRKLKEQS
jgi:glycosyltransferase involved in cell wall biosynthesis